MNASFPLLRPRAYVGPSIGVAVADQLGVPKVREFHFNGCWQALLPGRQDAIDVHFCMESAEEDKYRTELIRPVRGRAKVSLGQDLCKACAKSLGKLA